MTKLQEQLFEMQGLGYRDFHSKLMPTVCKDKIIGVRVPELRKLAKEQGKAIVLSTHDIDSAIGMADNLWLLSKGKHVRSGAPEDLIMDGTIGEFFSKENIVFDQSTGKLSFVLPKVLPVGISGDFQTSYWVGNALVRNGYTPSQIQDGIMNITCISPSDIQVNLPGGETKKATSVAHLCKIISELPVTA